MSCSRSLANYSICNECGLFLSRESFSVPVNIINVVVFVDIRCYTNFCIVLFWWEVYAPFRPQRSKSNSHKTFLSENKCLVWTLNSNKCNGTPRRKTLMPSVCNESGGGGGTQLFSGRGVRPRFPKCGACELTFASEKGGLWAENFQTWGLMSWKCPNLGACESWKFPNLGAWELKFGQKLRL